MAAWSLFFINNQPMSVYTQTGNDCHLLQLPSIVKLMIVISTLR